MKNHPHKSDLSKILMIFFCLVSYFEGISQTKYFIYEKNNKEFESSDYKLNTKSLYNIDREVRIFNLMTKVHTFIGKKGMYNGQYDYNIMLFSVLPDLAGTEDWVKINLDSIRSSIIDFTKLKELHKKNTLSYFNNIANETTKYFNDYKIIIKEGADYFMPKNCLLQFYSVRNRPQIFTNVYCTINTQESTCNISEFEKIFKSAYPDSPFPLYRMGENPLSFLEWARDRREYLSKKMVLRDGSKAYKFWTYIDWTQSENKYDYERGIDRFIYLPTKGIIGGSFDFYFYFNRKKLPIKYTDFLSNIKEEKVMMPDDFK